MLKHLHQQGAAFVTGFMAARAALVSVVPAASPRVWVLPATAAAVWVALLVSAGILDLRLSGTLGLTHESDWPTRPHAFAMTVLLWHGATIAGVTTLCASMGRRWLRWPSAPVRCKRRRKG